ncbi:hypothetical protein HK101_002636 [Irineochytrium annulatum]|nr:hypothetical protein HK101_002636 [Irineochytrium annulatum]
MQPVTLVSTATVFMTASNSPPLITPAANPTTPPPTSVTPPPADPVPRMTFDMESMSMDVDMPMQMNRGVMMQDNNPAAASTPGPGNAIPPVNGGSPRPQIVEPKGDDHLPAPSAPATGAALSSVGLTVAVVSVLAVIGALGFVVGRRRYVRGRERRRALEKAGDFKRRSFRGGTGMEDWKGSGVVGGGVTMAQWDADVKERPASYSSVSGRSDANRVRKRYSSLTWRESGDMTGPGVDAARILSSYDNEAPAFDWRDAAGLMEDDSMKDFIRTNSLSRWMPSISTPSAHPSTLPLGAGGPGGPNSRKPATCVSSSDVPESEAGGSVFLSDRYGHVRRQEAIILRAAAPSGPPLEPIVSASFAPSVSYEPSTSPMLVPIVSTMWDMVMGGPPPLQPLKSRPDDGKKNLRRSGDDEDPLSKMEDGEDELGEMVPTTRYGATRFSNRLVDSRNRRPKVTMSMISSSVGDTLSPTRSSFQPAGGGGSGVEVSRQLTNTSNASSNWRLFAAIPPPPAFISIRSGAPRGELMRGFDAIGAASASASRVNRIPSHHPSERRRKSSGRSIKSRATSRTSQNSIVSRVSIGSRGVVEEGRVRSWHGIPAWTREDEMEQDMRQGFSDGEEEESEEQVLRDNMFVPQFSMKATIPAEILDQVFAFIPVPDLVAVAVVSKAFFHSAAPLIWHRRILWTDEWDHTRSLFSKPRSLHRDYRAYIKEMQILTTARRSFGHASAERPHTHASHPTSAALGGMPGTLTGSSAAIPYTPLSNHTEPRLPGLRRFLQGCSALTALNCDTPCLGDEDLWVVLKACGATLAALSFVCGAEQQGRVTDEGLLAVGAHCSRLRHVRFRAAGGGAPPFSERGLGAIARAGGGQLMTFALEWLGPTRSAVSGPNGTAGGHGGSVGGAGGGGSEEGMLDSAVRRFADALAALIEANTGLKTLSLDWPVGVAEALAGAARSLKGLESLRVGNYKDVAAISAVVAANPTIVSVHLFDLPNRDVSALFDLPGMVQLHAPPPSPPASASSSEHPDSSVAAVTSPSSIFHTLRELHLDGVGQLRDIFTLVLRFTNLTRLKLLPSRLVASVAHMGTDDVARDVIQGLPHLRSLEMPVATNAPILALASRCPDLEELDVIDGSQISDAALIVLVKGCPRIRSLHLGSATALLDTSMLVMARALKLERLTLPFRNRNLTAKTLEYLADFCSDDLESVLNLPAACVERDALQTYLPRFPQLRAVGVCVAGGAGSSASAGRLFLSREGQQALKSRCRRLKVIHHNY